MPDNIQPDLIAQGVQDCGKREVFASRFFGQGAAHNGFSTGKMTKNTCNANHFDYSRTIEMKEMELQKGSATEISPMNEPIHINESSFDAAVLQSPVPVLVDFWATWCGPCKMIAPVLDELAKEGEGRYRVTKVDVDENPNLAQRFGIRGIPALVFFQGGQMKHQFTGVTAKGAIVAKLAELASSQCAVN